MMPHALEADEEASEQHFLASDESTVAPLSNVVWSNYAARAGISFRRGLWLPSWSPKQEGQAKGAGMAGAGPGPC